MKHLKTIRFIAGLLFVLAGAVVLADGVLNASVIEGVCGAVFVVLGIADLLPDGLLRRKQPEEESAPEEARDDADDAASRRRLRVLQRITGALLVAAGAISLYIGVTGGRRLSIIASVLFIASGVIDFISAHFDARG